ncbi:Cthe_2314 family HEPN domain-containing protein [Zoogloea sp.]|uniref:Cthe_2314 family HEPN domain-containing protein n=1 Tax=Zoogloea sp. TaxID=49181 RepID=UPI0035ADD417
MFIDHPVLKPLSPHLRTYAAKGLHEARVGGKSFRATALELYAANVFERVGELDSCVQSMRLAMFCILDLAKTPEAETNVYRYHYENFILRLAGVVDRAHRLVGVSMRLKPKTFEKLGGNAVVAKHLRPNHPVILDRLGRIEAVASKKKGLRNDIAHSKAFSSRELGLFSAIELLEYTGVEAVEVKSLMGHYFTGGGSELAALIAESVTAVEQLLETLGPVFEEVCRECA